MPNEPLQEVADVEAAPPLKRLRTGREDYRRLLMEKMRAPDGGYEEGFTVPGSGASPPRTEGSSGNLEKNNPLSLHDEVRRSASGYETPALSSARTHGASGLLPWNCARPSCRTWSERAPY